MIISLPLVQARIVTTTIQMGIPPVWFQTIGLHCLDKNACKSVQKVRLAHGSEYQNASPWEGREQHWGEERETRCSLGLSFLSYLHEDSSKACFPQWYGIQILIPISLSSSMLCSQNQILDITFSQTFSNVSWHKCTNTRIKIIIIPDIQAFYIYPIISPFSLCCFPLMIYGKVCP